MRNRRLSPESRAKISAANKGDKSPILNLPSSVKLNVTLKLTLSMLELIERTHQEGIDQIHHSLENCMKLLTMCGTFLPIFDAFIWTKLKRNTVNIHFGHFARLITMMTI